MEGQPPKPQNDEQVTDDATAEPSGAATPELPGNQATDFVSSTPQEDSKNNRFSNESKTNEGVSTSNASLHQWGQNENVEVIPSEREGFDSLNHSLGKFSISNEPPKNPTTFNSTGNQNQHENAIVPESGQVADSGVCTDESKQIASNRQSPDEAESRDLDDAISSEGSESEEEDQERDLKIEVEEIGDRVKILTKKIEELNKKKSFLDSTDLQMGPEYKKYSEEAIRDRGAVVEKYQSKEKVFGWEKEEKDLGELKEKLEKFAKIFGEKEEENNHGKLEEKAKKFAKRTIHSETEITKELDILDLDLKKLEIGIFTLDEIDPLNLYQMMPRDKKKNSTGDQYNISMKEARGIFLVLCHTTFQDIKSSTRRGAAESCKKLKNAFRKIYENDERFRFRFIIKWNLTKENSLKVIQKCAQIDHAKYDCFVCAVMTHGSKKDRIRAYDETYTTRDLCQPFEKCESLRGKPKIFFIQACRGRNRDFGIKLDSDANESDSGSSEKNDKSRMEKPALVPESSDTLIAYSTTEGTVSSRNIKEGSHFINALSSYVEQYSCFDLLTLLTMVTKEVAKKTFRKTEKAKSKKEEIEVKGLTKQCPTITSRLTIPFHFLNHTCEHEQEILAMVTKEVANKTTPRIEKLTKRKHQTKQGAASTNPLKNGEETKKKELTGPSIYENSSGIFLILIHRYTSGEKRAFFEDVRTSLSAEKIEAHHSRAENDAKELEKVGKGFGFEVETRDVYTSNQISKVIKEYITSENETNIKLDTTNFGCVICAILALGDGKDQIRTNDSSYNVKKIIQKFCDCEYWAGKPKLFFVQAEVNATLRSLPAKKKRYTNRDKVTLVPREADVLVMFPSIKDDPTDNTSGSLFIASLTKHIWGSCDLHLLKILTKVVEEVAQKQIRKSEDRSANDQCPTILSRLTSLFYFKKAEDQPSGKAMCQDQ